MEKDNIRLQKLLKKYLEEQTMTVAELRALQTFIQDEQYAPYLDGLLKKAFTHAAYQEQKGVDPVLLFQNIQERQQRSSGAVHAVRKWYAYAAAALILVTLSIGLYVYTHRTSHPVTISEQWAGRDIDPGGNKAYLTLADGRRVVLSEQQVGIRLSEAGVSYLDGSSLEGAPPSQESTTVPVQLKLTTPKGGQYQVVLPDGTKVWLNAGSELSYPDRFADAERRVVLNGEAYFEVQHTLKNKPFIVQTASQWVEVLGTHFNIQAYADEKHTATTLLEGSVRVSAPVSSDGSNPSSQILKPNQQSILVRGSDAFRIARVDPAVAVAWKNGLFHFENATIQNVMREMARWYDLEIEYKGRFTDDRFNGKVYRDMTLGQVLDVLSFSKIHFELEGRRLIIYPSRDN